MNQHYRFKMEWCTKKFSTIFKTLLEFSIKFIFSIKEHDTREKKGKRKKEKKLTHMLHSNSFF